MSSKCRSILWIVGIQLTLTRATASRTFISSFSHRPLQKSLLHHHHHQCHGSQSIPLLNTRQRRYFSCKFQQFRLILYSHLQNQDSPSHSPSSSTTIAQQVLSVLTTQNPKKTWQRLEPILELASSLDMSTNQLLHKESIADIGCDHGLLAFALASLGQYHQIIGIDVSHEALQNGAYRVRDKVQEILQYSSNDDPISKEIHKANQHLFDRVEFRYGNGLCPLLPGEAQTVCIMGMGAETMLDILCQSHHGPIHPNLNDPSPRLVDFLGTRYLLLQPTPSRPRNLVQLYQTLDTMGWKLVDERINHVSSRWYISCAFEKRLLMTHDTTAAEVVPFRSFPGQILNQSTDVNVIKEYQRYVQHHLSWILQDRERSKSSSMMMNPDEQMWLDAHIHWI